MYCAKLIRCVSSVLHFSHVPFIATGHSTSLSRLKVKLNDEDMINSWSLRGGGCTIFMSVKRGSAFHLKERDIHNHPQQEAVEEKGKGGGGGGLAYRVALCYSLYVPHVF